MTEKETNFYLLDILAPLPIVRKPLTLSAPTEERVRELQLIKPWDKPFDWRTPSMEELENEL